MNNCKIEHSLLTWIWIKLELQGNIGIKHEIKILINSKE